MAEEKNVTKSGISSPAMYNSKPPENLEAPTKVYPASSQLSKGSSKSGGMIEGPASGKNDDKPGA